MTIKIDLKDDAELRAYIKDMIKGQVISIARAEIHNIVKEAFSDKVQAPQGAALDNLFKQEISRKIEKELQFSVWSQPGFIKNEARTIIERIIKESLSKNPVV